MLKDTMKYITHLNDMDNVISQHILHQPISTRYLHQFLI